MSDIKPIKIQTKSGGQCPHESTVVNKKGLKECKKCGARLGNTTESKK